MNLTSFTASLRRHGGLALAALSFGSGLTMLSASPASAAAVIHVTTTDDDYTVNGNCTLREAIGAHNFQKSIDACEAGNGPSTIEVPAGVYYLTVAQFSEPKIQYGDLNIFKDRPALTINGAGMNHTVIDAGKNYGIFEVASALTVSNMTLKNAAKTSAINVVREAVGIDRVLLDGNMPSAVEGSTGLQIGVIDSRFTGTNGTAIWARGPFDLYRSTVDGNQLLGTNAPAIRMSGSVANIVNSTFTKNTGAAGSAIYASDGSQLSIDSSTIAGNTDTSGQNIVLESSSSTVTITRSLLDGHCSGPGFTDGGRNVATVASNCITAANSAIVASLGVAALADNGGATPTMALLAGSPALGSVTSGCLSDDQRGQARASVCDAGAYEADPSVQATTTTSSSTTSTTSTTTTTLVLGPGIEPNQDPQGEPGKPGPDDNGGNGGNGQKNPGNAPQPMTPSATVPPAVIPPAINDTPSSTASSTPSTPSSTEASTPGSVSVSAPATVKLAEPGDLAAGKSVIVLGELVTGSTVPTAAPAVASPVDLAYTGGSHPMPMTALAVGLMALGVVIVAASRRRSAR